MCVCVFVCSFSLLQIFLVAMSGQKLNKYYPFSCLSKIMREWNWNWFEGLIIKSNHRPWEDLNTFFNFKLGVIKTCCNKNLWEQVVTCEFSPWKHHLFFFLFFSFHFHFRHQGYFPMTSLTWLPFSWNNENNSKIKNWMASMTLWKALSKIHCADSIVFWFGLFFVSSWKEIWNLTEIDISFHFKYGEWKTQVPTTDSEQQPMKTNMWLTLSRIF